MIEATIVYCIVCYAFMFMITLLVMKGETSTVVFVGFGFALLFAPITSPFFIWYGHKTSIDRRKG